MKKIILIILPLLLAACGAPGPAVTVTTENNAVLATRTIIPPTDIPAAAPTFLPTSNAPTLKLGLLQLVDADHGWAIGGLRDSRSLLRTSDGGTTWSNVTPPDVSMENTVLVGLDADTAWFTSTVDTITVNGTGATVTVWRTRDSGLSWSPGAPVTVDLSVRDVLLQFVDSLHGWLAVHHSHKSQEVYFLYRTGDGGATWELLSSTTCEIPYTLPCDVPVFINRYTGWRKMSSQYSSISSMKKSHIWQVNRTLDGGHTWGNISLPIPDDLLKILSTDEYSPGDIGCHPNFERVDQGMVAIRMDCAIFMNGWIYPPVFTKSYYYISSDGGRRWDFFPAVGELIFVDRFIKWRLTGPDDRYALDRTTDGGIIWQKMAENILWSKDFQDSLPWSAANVLDHPWNLGDFSAQISPWRDRCQFVDADRGWVTQSENGFGIRHLWRTLDGGQTWSEIKPVMANH